MSSSESEEPAPGRATRHELYELADSIAVDLATEPPDWCAIARDAKRMAREIQAKCDLTRRA